MPSEAPGLTDQIYRSTQRTLVKHSIYLKERHLRRKARKENEMKKSNVRVAALSQSSHFLPGPFLTQGHMPSPLRCGMKLPRSLQTGVVEVLPPLELGREIRCPSASSRCPCSLPWARYPQKIWVYVLQVEKHITKQPNEDHHHEDKTPEMPTKTHSSLAWRRDSPGSSSKRRTPYR